MFQAHQTNDLLNASCLHDVIIRVFTGNSPEYHISSSVVFSFLLMLAWKRQLQYHFLCVF